MNPLSPLNPGQGAEPSGPHQELPTRAELLARTQPDVREPAGSQSEGISPLAAGMVLGGLLAVGVLALALKRAKVSA
jgi:hypothetical protein